jgi:integrase
MAKARLRWLVCDTDRHGNERYYVRLPKCRKVRIKAEPGSDEFSRLYAAAISGTLAPLAAPSASKNDPASFEWLCNQYYHSTDFKVEIGAGTQRARRNILHGLCKTIGHLPYGRIEAQHVQKWMDKRADHPEAANNLLKSLKGLFKFAARRQLVKASPVAAVTKIKTDTEGFHTWTLEEVRRFEDRHPIGTVPRLALALLLYTGQRRGDVVRMGRQHVEDGVMRIRRGKTKKTDKTFSYLPVLPELQAILDASPCGDLTFLVNKWGVGFSAAGFGNAMRQWCDEAGLPHCTAHGLRKAGAVVASENGATDRQLMAIFGWKKAEMATLYTEQAEQKKLAREGMGKLVSRTGTER